MKSFDSSHEPHALAFIGRAARACRVRLLGVGGSNRRCPEFVERHPTEKMLALSFLLLIGVTLSAEGFDQHVPKGYVYLAMAFSLFVEMINVRVRARSTPVHLPGGISAHVACRRWRLLRGGDS